MPRTAGRQAVMSPMRGTYKTARGGGREARGATYAERLHPMTVSETAVPPVVNIADALGRFTEQWAQRRIGGVNDYDVKVAKVQGEFVWHTHDDTDELLLVISGRLTVRFRAGDVELAPGEFVVVPRGVEHC